MSLLLLFGNAAIAPAPPPAPPVVDEGGPGYYPQIIIELPAPARATARLRVDLTLRVDGRVSRVDEEGLLALLLD